MNLRILIALLLIALTATRGNAQTCCSGGVPVSSNLGLPPSAGQTLQFSLTYDLNVLETLKSGTRREPDNNRSRRTHSTLLELGYSFNERFSVDGFFSFVRQEREITNNLGNRNFTFSQGVGDAVFLLKYKLLANRNDYTTLHAALGVKAPFGPSDLRDGDSPVQLPADLQPGSGAWDGILWAQLTHVLALRPSMSLILTGTYSYKGVNDNYFGGRQSYQFGQEFFVLAGVSDRLLLGKSVLIDPALTLRYRQVRPDRVDELKLPSTGGRWLFINPSLSYWPRDDLSISAGVEFPLFADITGTQVTPTYRLNVGAYYRISLKNSEVIHPTINF